MKNSTFFLSFLFIAFFVSCKKETPVINTPKPAYIDSSKFFLDNLAVDAESEYYISGVFDGKPLYFASVYGNLYPYNDTGFNAIYYNEAIGLDNIHLLRQNNNFSGMIAIYFDQAKIFTRQFPYRLPNRTDPSYQAAEVTLLDMVGLRSAPPGTFQNDYEFTARTKGGAMVEVTSFTDNVMEGIFQGTLKNPKGSSIKVENGKFRLKVIVI